MRKVLSLLIAIIGTTLAFCFANPTEKSPNLKNGDLLFITSSSGQGKAIQLATKSKLTHIGIVFIENGKV